MANEEALKPLILRTAEGKTVDVTLLNEKAYRKSIEQRQIWHIHRGTGRLVPYGDGETGFSELRECRSWYEAVVDAVEASEASGMPLAAAGLREHADGEPAETFHTDSISPESVIEYLVKTIRQRHHEMPEGSYTTHLFESGIEKIKKKTGEEAIELILAAGRTEIVYEAADLFYHLLVLLEASEISFEGLT